MLTRTVTNSRTHSIGVCVCVVATAVTAEPGHSKKGFRLYGKRPSSIVHCALQCVYGRENLYVDSSSSSFLSAAVFKRRRKKEKEGRISTCSSQRLFLSYCYRSNSSIPYKMMNCRPIWLFSVRDGRHFYCSIPHTRTNRNTTSAQLSSTQLNSDTLSGDFIKFTLAATYM